MSATVEQLRRKRGHRRGVLTRYSRRCSALASKLLPELSLDELQSLSRDIDNEVEKHDDIQEQIEELLYTDKGALEAEYAERDRCGELYDELVRDVRSLSTRVSAFHTSSTLLARTRAVLASKECSQHSQDELQSVSTRFVELGEKTLATFSPEIADLYSSLSSALTEARDHLARLKNAATPARSDAVTPSTPAHTPSSRLAPLTIDLPTFDGDPLSWANFENLFKNLLITRADSLSNMDKRSLLSNAIKCAEGQHLLHAMADKDVKVELLIETLRKRFGRAEIVVPLRNRQVLSDSHIDDDYTGLRSVIDNVVLGYRALDAHIGDSLSEFLTYHVRELFRPALRAEWEKHISGSIDRPTIDDLEQFIERRLLHKTPLVSNPRPSFAYKQPAYSPMSSSISRPTSPRPQRPNPKCVVCSESHLLIRCPTFISFDVDRRNKLVREHRLCLNCFSGRHGCKNCPSRFTCKTCGSKHHTLLHKDRETATPTQSSVGTVSADQSMIKAPPEPEPLQDPPQPLSPCFPHTLTATLENGPRTTKARVMLDSGADVSLMTEKLATTLGLKRYPQPMVLSGNFAKVTSEFYVVTNLFSHSRDFKSRPISFIVVPKLRKASIPDDPDALTQSPVLQQAPLLADPDFGADVDIYLGSLDIVSCITDGPSVADGLSIYHSPFGLCVSGPRSSSTSTTASTLATSAVPDDLPDALAKLWELDQVPEAPILSPDDVQAVQHFHDNVRRVDGRFSVSVPRVNSPRELGDSRRQALKRLFSNERSLSAKGKLEAFNVVLREYVDLGHAQIIPRHELSIRPHYYLPVHGIFKASSTTTKCRAVFDASAVSSTGTSLNDTLLTGPNLYPPSRTYSSVSAVTALA